MILIFTYHAVSSAEGKRGKEFYTVTGGQLERHFDALAAAGRECISLRDLRQARPLPVKHFMLTFDDATADHAEIVASLLKKRGWTATFFVPTFKLDRPGYMTREQVRELFRAGYTIGLHGHEHRRLNLSSDDDLRDQIGRSRQIVSDLIGGKPWLFAPVGGFMNEHAREVALGFGVEVLRTMRWGYNREPDRTNLETIPINRHTDDEKFRRILELRQTRHLYFGKQAVKALVPARAYERLRSLLFKMSKRN